MTDRLTQLQDAIDNMLTLQFTLQIYNQTKHPYADIPGQLSQAPKETKTEAGQLTNGDTTTQQPNGPSQPQKQAQQQAQQEGPEEEKPPVPDTPENFERALRELAQAMVLQEQQMEVLINSLPGLERNEAEQVQRMKALEAELREVEAERVKAEEERVKMLDALGGVMVGARRVP
ncbi:hypothetical protein KC332_g9740 [Hortaea werneckii]|uniref:Mediator of RNA polymerase II transcription subunit 21 n=2 Tax=Hortaea werneckii TaxID=91943 RepID=A0A3M7JEW4_HORWE|nr:hypothetical protein KC358_g9627 [Hortaea werneckii]OTA37331.1 hypothetical protein BTJ68_03092 [Hortaea werneckii EXF-2000]KAI6825238.1 hypothetical protein KC350_g8834 [Hortaea werneckii]KAI6832483.1 hypothetical protein KC342_g7300 [Hortaea werneckii]KAI6922425.1 hypothetical protein KC348_g9782 [Hortaea werneckii]